MISLGSKNLAELGWNRNSSFLVNLVDICGQKNRHRSPPTPTSPSDGSPLGSVWGFHSGATGSRLGTNGIAWGFMGQQAEIQPVGLLLQYWPIMVKKFARLGPKCHSDYTIYSFRASTSSVSVYVKFKKQNGN
ncbi:hypothetical protein WCLP8_1970010 [uncultured Gammaproteobacteria bacterium]